jgi:hypothetical protein
MLAYELIPLNDDEHSRYLVCADDAEALAVAPLLRLADGGQLWHGFRRVGSVAPLTPSGRHAAA